ncbi:MAG: MipA/OmpV family protein, partial [Pseudomonadota bacterium]
APADALRADLPVYDAGGGLRDIGVDAYSIVSFSERSGVFLRAAFNRLLGDFADSPIVDPEGSANQWFAGVGYFRRF